MKADANTGLLRADSGTVKTQVDGLQVLLVQGLHNEGSLLRQMPGNILSSSTLAQSCTVSHEAQVCQGAEEGMACQLLEECPIPELAAKYHPYMRASRRRGNKTLEMGLVNKFMCRGGGFVSTKHETHLAEQVNGALEESPVG